MVPHPPNEEHIDGQMVKMEVNLDDISGEWLGYVMDVLFEAGANDVFYTPIYMKKNRPGILLQLLCSKTSMEKMKEILLRETTTLGIRYYPLTVHRMERNFKKVQTDWGAVTVKQGISNGEVFQSSPEFEDCKEIAKRMNVPLKKVYEQVWQALAENRKSN
ncbi:nickel insertion protein [Aquibacillus sediminis]|uniref:nickel insertion protein n=1 Tax=Aquibacillus sediminis TaxID=2574734 RepID=UPI001107D9A5|nr:nickel insertion protein [Aquibacillus sediminis]